MTIEVQALSKRFPVKPVKPVLNGISAKFPTGHVSVIVGNNGSGKSTLLNCVLGLLRFEEGNIKVDNNGVVYDIAPETLNAIPIAVRHKIGYIFQHKALWQHLTVLDNLIHPLAKIRKKTPSGYSPSISRSIQMSFPVANKGKLQSPAPWRWNQSCSSSTNSKPT
jgi:polar amino acid transport system ATP-binding protein